MVVLTRSVPLTSLTFLARLSMMNPASGGQLPLDVLTAILRFADLRGLNGCRMVGPKTALKLTSTLCLYRLGRQANPSSHRQHTVAVLPPICSSTWVSPFGGNSCGFQLDGTKLTHDIARRSLVTRSFRLGANLASLGPFADTLDRFADRRVLRSPPLANRL